MKCKICGQNVQMLSLVKMPIPGYSVEKEEAAHPIPSYPYNLCYCDCCNLVFYEQFPEATETLNHIYCHYQSTSSFEEVLDHEVKQMADELLATVPLKPDDTILEIGCNSGSLLKAVQDVAGCRAVGVEPSGILTDFWSKYGFQIVRTREEFLSGSAWLQVLPSFFDASTAGLLREKKYKLIVLSHVLEHLDPIVEMVTLLAQLMDSKTTLVIEVPYFPLCMKKSRLDDLVFEHINHFTIRSMAELLSKANLGVRSYSLNETGGGSIRFYIEKNRQTDPAMTDSLSYQELFHFVAGLNENRARLARLLEEYPAGSVVGYGGKMAQYLLYLFGLEKYIQVIWNDTDLFEGKYVPGSEIHYVKPDFTKPIQGVQAVLGLAPYYTRILAKKVPEGIDFIDVVDSSYDKKL